MSRIECPSEAWDRHVTQNEECCEVCHEHIDKCDCPECPKCGSVGDSDCYEKHGLKPACDSVASLCDWIGIAPIDQCLRTVDKYKNEHIWLVLPRPAPNSGTANNERIYYHNYERLKELKPWHRIYMVGVGGNAGDGTDWEYAEEVTAGRGWARLSEARDRFEDALEGHRALMDEEEEV